MNDRLTPPFIPNTTNIEADPFDPVIATLRGMDPQLAAAKAGISPEELDRRKAQFLQQRAKKALQEEALFQKVGRNDPCPCGSGMKYKKCCLPVHEKARASMDPEQLQRIAKRKRLQERLKEAYKEGYALLAQRDYRGAIEFANRWLRRYLDDDHFHDMIVTANLYLGIYHEAIRVCEIRLREALREKAFFMEHGFHSYGDDKHAHFYSPEAWLERYWAALKAQEYHRAYPDEPDVEIEACVKALKEAEDPTRFPHRGLEGLKARREALAPHIQRLKELGPGALPYLLPLCVVYGWSGLLVPEILAHWADEASIRALIDISMFQYPYLSESCYTALEHMGQRALPSIREAFQRDTLFDPLKIGLMSVAAKLQSNEAYRWLADLLDSPHASVVNWAAGLLGKARYTPALPKLEKARGRVGSQPNLDWAIDELKAPTS